ncbi:chloride transport protein 6-like isoform X2 [Cimex lectularius]|nr:chloride transport protein 6-like isoform X2 [Cimex lectularius]XP_024084241.1 chloride transport protein 6-like isoform X2 [Cimex lectularius]
MKTACFATVGIGTGIAAVFILIFQEVMAEFKYHALLNVLDNHQITSPLVILFWFSGVIIPLLIGCLIVIYIEPKAAGEGIANVIGYLNGVNTSTGNTMKIMIVKFFSVFGTMASGIAGGMEGPLIHIGACIASCISNLRLPFHWCIRPEPNFNQPFRRLQTDLHRRDLVGGGMAAGISGGFFAPFGGLIMVLEEGLIYCTSDVMVGILICSIVCQVFVVTVMSIIFGCEGCQNQRALLFFSTPTKSNGYKYRDIGLIILEAVIAGLLGAAWNYCQLRLILLRNIYVKTNGRRISEALVLALITAGIGWLQLAGLQQNCVDEPSDVKGFNFASLKLKCKSGQINGVGTLIGLSQPSAIKFLFYDSDSFDMTTLLIYSITYFFLSTATMGTYISAGIFVPNILLGAAWGRFYGEFWKAVAFPYEDFRPHIFAIVGAGAQLCGVIRVPLTIAIIMIETCSAYYLTLPIFIAMMISTVVGNTINESIYHIQCLVAGMPIIEKDPSPLCMRISVQDVMEKSVVSLQKEESIQNVLFNLMSTTHNIFPILKGKILVGSVRRCQLIQILRYNLFNKDFVQSYEIMKGNDNPPWTINDIDLNLYDLDQIIDLGLYMNNSPYSLKMDSSIVNAHKLMSHMGARHVIIVNELNEVVGILTRKDIVYLRKKVSTCAVRLIYLPRK